ncbi:hypothetical protein CAUPRSCDRAFT_12306 [Caulochytrium protostelioides]|uniref:Dynein heavy chain AAA module D4 domain-containing protein n=1 Tax=Caulochytrium protostelioides TaxID=1555241 RepID=A0A4P9WRX6_9FUNG|nr:hypothetical protein CAUPRSCDRAFT_12306 [Caulochytrium protostelioides]
MTAIYETMLSKFGVGFPSEIQNLVPRVVRATLELYCTIRDTCLPTPQKSHYTFNMRDVSRVFVGLLAVAPADLATGGEHSDVVAEFGRAWRHEGRRVFMDRLVDDTDINWFLEAQTDCYVKHFPPLPEPIDAGETILYGNYLIPGRDVKPYVAIRDLKRLEKLMDEYLDEYNSLHPNNKMKLVLFLDAIEHVSRICRTLSQPNGHALLLGIGGSGRQSLAKLAIFMQEYEPFTVELSKNYGQKEWRDDIRKLLMNAGVENKKVAFLLSDTQLVSDACLEDINNLLNGGDVPNLHGRDHVDDAEELRCGQRNVEGPALQCLSEPDPQEHACRVLHEPRWRRLPTAAAHVPVTHQLHDDGLVPHMADRGPAFRCRGADRRDERLRRNNIRRHRQPVRDDARDRARGLPPGAPAPRAHHLRDAQELPGSAERV